MSQAQPILPVTMPYGDNAGYGNKYYGEFRHLDNGLRHLEHDIHRSSNDIRRDVQHGAESVDKDVLQSAESIRRDVQHGTEVLRSDLSQDTASIVASVNAQAVADAAAIRASVIETRQAIERNADYVNGNIYNTSTQGLLATQNTATATQLGIQNTSTATQLGVSQSAAATQLGIQQTAADTQSHISDTKSGLHDALSLASSQAERIAGESRAIAYNQTQLILTDNKEIAIAQARDLGHIQLQAADYKAYLQNHITATAAEGVLKTVESTAKIMEKLAECCCENKMSHSATQNIVIQNANNNQQAFQQGENNRLQQALAAAQQDALVARLGKVGL